MVTQKIDLEQKWAFVPTPMIQEPFFTLPIAATPTTHDVVVPAPVVSSPVVATNQNEEPILHDSIEPIAADEEKATTAPSRSVNS